MNGRAVPRPGDARVRRNDVAAFAFVNETFVLGNRVHQFGDGFVYVCEKFGAVWRQLHAISRDTSRFTASSVVC